MCHTYSLHRQWRPWFVVILLKWFVVILLEWFVVILSSTEPRTSLTVQAVCVTFVLNLCQIYVKYVSYLCHICVIVIYVSVTLVTYTVSGQKCPLFDPFFFVKIRYVLGRTQNLNKNLLPKIWRYLVTSNLKLKIFSNFLAFSELPIFIVNFGNKIRNKCFESAKM